MWYNLTTKFNVEVLAVSKKLYEILGVNEKASLEEIQKAFRKKGLILHPDKHRDDTDSDKAKAEEAFKFLSRAYAILSDSKSRKEYDTGSIDDEGRNRPASAESSTKYSTTRAASSVDESFDDPSFIKFYASRIVTLNELQQAIRLVKAHFHQVLYDNVSFVDMIKRCDEVGVLLDYLAQTTDPIGRLGTILNEVSEIKFQAVLKSLAIKQNIIAGKESFVALLNTIKIDAKYEEVVFQLLLQVIKANSDLEFVLHNQPPRRGQIVIELLQGRLAEQLEGPALNIVAPFWKLGGQASEVSGRKIPFTLFGFSHLLIPNIRRLDPGVKIWDADDVGMIAEFSDETHHLSFKDVLDLQEQEDKLAHRETSDLFGLWMDSERRSILEQSVEVLSERMGPLTQKYHAKAAFFKAPNSNGMGYHGKGATFDELRARSFAK